MKKTAAPKKTVKKVVHHRAKPVQSNRTKYLLIIAAVLLVLFLLPPTKKTIVGQFKGSATAEWTKVDGAAYYNVYYKKSSDPDFYHSVKVPSNATTYTIKGLKKGETYEYKVAAVNENGEEYLWTSSADDLSSN